MEELIQLTTTTITTNLWLAPILVFLAGIVTAFSPCCLSTVPLIIGYIGGNESQDTKKTFKLSLVFSLGLITSTVLLGVVVSLLGTIIQMLYLGDWWFVLLGVLMLLMAFQIWEVVNIIPSTYLTSKSNKRGKLGAYLTGLLAGLFSTPCSTPILVTVLALVAQKGDLLYGIALLLAYSIGHSVLFILLGTFTGIIKRIIKTSKYSTVTTVLKWLSGIVVMILGLYLIYQGV